MVSAGPLLKFDCSSWRGSFVKAVGRRAVSYPGPALEKAPCTRWACRDPFCLYSKAGRGEVSESCCPGKVENSD